MPSLYHFKSDQYKENLILGNQQHMVAGRLCQYLKGWQLDGIRFLYKHFEKGEACILNDESGLGKVVTISVFLGAILSNDTTKKCLIVVRDDEHIEGWRFHLSVLTHLTVKVIERPSDINYETVFLIKWSTLKNIGQITKVTFDHVIIDNRGEMLNNKFCTGILLRYFENKTSLVISSTDVTADMKLLHILLRLCGRLDKQYTDVKLFEDKFQLPKLKDGVCTKVNLEDYFLKREKVINFCREFRLRRYCHQFDEEFPLVACSEFQRHLEQWRNTDNSQSSGSVKLLSSSSEKDIEELFKEYFQVKKECKPDSEVQQITEHMGVVDDDLDVSDEVVVMSPLLFVSESESESEQGVQVEIGKICQKEVKEEEAKPEGDEDAIKETNKPFKRNQRKSLKPVKRLTLQIEHLPYKTRSRNVPLCDSILSIGRKPRKLKLTDKNVNTPERRGRKPMIKQLTNGRPRKLVKDEEFKRKEEQRTEKKVNKKEVQGNNKSKDKKGEENEKKNLVQLEETATKDVERNVKVDKAKKEISKTKQGWKNAKKDDGNTSLKLKDIKTKLGDNEKIMKKKTAELEKQKQRISEVEKLDKRGTKIYMKENEKEQQEKEKPNPNKNNSSTKDLEKKNKTKPKTPEEENRTIRHAGHENNCTEVDIDTSKQAKEEENKSRQENEKAEMKQKELKTTDRRKSTPKRHVQLDMILKEAKKFLKHNCDTKRTARKTRAPFDSNPSTVTAKLTRSSSKNITSQKTTSIPRKTQGTAITPLKPSSTVKIKTDTPKRSKPLTVYTPLGVHSKSTRGMQRQTRSSLGLNKYMQIAVAQVGINKSTARRLKLRRKSVAPVHIKNSAVEKTTPQPPPISESPAILESMQFGQALTPTNCSQVSGLSAQPRSHVTYNFPLMLDKEISDTECVLTSQNSNNNEVIVLTGSSTTENEMEPPKSTVFRRKTFKKPPMVIIPRPFYSKAKSPDLFSTCSDVSLPCSQQNNKSHFEGFKIFGSELRQPIKQRSCLDILDRILEPRNAIATGSQCTQFTGKPAGSAEQRCIEDEDAMFEITSNGTFSNIVRVNSNGDMSPVRNKGLSTPPIVANPKNRITNYLISNGQHASGTPQSSSFEDATDLIPKTPKRRKSLSGIAKRSPRSLSGGITGGKSQSTKLTQWLIKNAVVRIGDTLPKPLTTKRRRLELSFTDD